MKKKLRSLLSEKCKDMGLTDKALDELTEVGSTSLKDDATEDNVVKLVDSLVPFAKAMQAEITRKTRKDTKPSKKTPSKEEGAEEGEEEKGDKEVPEWFKAYGAKLDALEAENAALKADKAKSERKSLIAEKAKKLGIPEYLMKRYSIADDADIDADLEEYKQDLITNNLLPKEALETGDPAAQMKADADSWAKGLPDK